MHSRSDNIKIMINDEADEFFDSLKNRYQNNLESMESNHGGSYIDFPALIKNKIKTKTQQ